MSYTTPVERRVLKASKAFIKRLIELDTKYKITLESEEEAREVCELLNQLESSVRDLLEGKYK